MKRIIIFLFIVYIIANMISCYASLENYRKEPCKKLPNETVVTALKENCVSCHRNDFNTKEDICSRKSIIIDAVSKGRMPKMGKLYDHYKKTLVEWK